MLKVCSTVEKVAGTNATVMLLGESGTGKEILARAVHSLSTRREGRLATMRAGRAGTVPPAAGWTRLPSP